jgi:hypothetical protein
LQWAAGYVTSVQPLRVSIEDDPNEKSGIVWDEVRAIFKASLQGGVAAEQAVVSLVDYENNSGEKLCKGDRGTTKGIGVHGKDRDKRVEVQFPNMKSVSLLPSQFKELERQIVMVGAAPIPDNIYAEIEAETGWQGHKAADDDLDSNSEASSQSDHERLGNDGNEYVSADLLNTLISEGDRLRAERERLRAEIEG